MERWDGTFRVPREAVDTYGRRSGIASPQHRRATVGATGRCPYGPGTSVVYRFQISLVGTCFLHHSYVFPLSFLCLSFAILTSFLRHSCLLRHSGESRNPEETLPLRRRGKPPAGHSPSPLPRIRSGACPSPLPPGERREKTHAEPIANRCTPGHRGQVARRSRVCYPVRGVADVPAR